MLAGSLASGRVTGYIREPLLTKDYFQRISYSDWAKASEHTRTRHILKKKSQELQTALTLQCSLEPWRTAVDQSEQSKPYISGKILNQQNERTKKLYSEFKENNRAWCDSMVYLTLELRALCLCLFTCKQQRNWCVLFLELWWPPHVIPICLKVNYALKTKQQKKRSKYFLCKCIVLSLLLCSKFYPNL